MTLRGAYNEPIEYLRRELYQARRTIVHLMPEEIQNLFNGYYHCESRLDTRKWERDVVEQIIRRAAVLPTHPILSSSDRAYCPLCGEGSSSPYESGFALPEGLSRHLCGWGNTRQCDVMEAVRALARDYWETQSSKWDEAERARINERCKSEILFVVSYGSSPKLIEEGLYCEHVRTPDSLASAEKRLVKMGFSLHSDGHVKSYTFDKDNFLVFADPRAEGYIEFLIYKKPLPQSSHRLSNGDFHRLRVYDTWKRNLREKFECRFAKVTGQSQR